MDILTKSNDNNKLDKSDKKAERKEKMDEMTSKLEAGIEKIMTQPGAFQDFLKAQAKAPRRSFNNTLLIMLQKPDATLCCGYMDWQKKYGRNVNANEKGLMIYQPARGYRFIEETVLDKNGNKIYDSNGSEVKHKVKQPYIYFKPGYVFDVSQTSGKPIPTLDKVVVDLEGNVEGFDDVMAALDMASPVPQRYEHLENGVHGYFSRTANEIVLHDELSEAMQVKTYSHEIGHAILHSVNGLDPDASREIKELTAESIAFIVAEHIGIDSSGYSFGYCASWFADHSPKEIASHMDVIRKAASQIIDSYDTAIELVKAKSFNFDPEFDKISLLNKDGDIISAKIEEDNSVSISMKNLSGQESSMTATDIDLGNPPDLHNALEMIVDTVYKGEGIKPLEEHTEIPYDYLNRDKSEIFKAKPKEIPKNIDKKPLQDIFTKSGFILVASNEEWIAFEHKDYPHYFELRGVSTHSDINDIANAIKTQFTQDTIGRIVFEYYGEDYDTAGNMVWEDIGPEAKAIMVAAKELESSIDNYAMEVSLESENIPDLPDFNNPTNNTEIDNSKGKSI